MILSGHLTTDHGDRGATPRGSSMPLAVVETRRRTAEDAVEALVEVWRSSTGPAQEQAWDDMEGPVREVIDALSSLLGALDLARAEHGPGTGRDVRPVPAPRSPA